MRSLHCRALSIRIDFCGAGIDPGLQNKEEIMGRKFIDCREYPSTINCTVAMSANSESELLEVAVQHAVAMHGHQDTAELRNMLRKAIKEGMPPA